MTLSDIFNNLKYGELAQVAISDVSDEENRKRLISNINLAITEIYKRFPLKVKEVIIQLYPQIATYYLLNKFTDTVGTEPITYIKDSIYYPFEESELISIEEVFTENREEVPINDQSKVYSVFTPTYNSILHPYPDNENAISVIYRAKPANISLDANDNTIIDIPTYLEEALLVYVAARVAMTINSESRDIPNYFAKFEGLCNNINIYGLVNKENFTNLRLNQNGWV